MIITHECEVILLYDVLRESEQRLAWKMQSTCAGLVQIAKSLTRNKYILGLNNDTVAA